VVMLNPVSSYLTLLYSRLLVFNGFEKHTDKMIPSYVKSVLSWVRLLNVKLQKNGGCLGVLRFYFFYSERL
jgi:hypothetical protein